MFATTAFAHSSAFASPRWAIIAAHQRQVVEVAARARADLALALRVGELLVGRDVAPASPSPCRRRSTRARHREAEPVARRDRASSAGIARRAPRTSPAGTGPAARRATAAPASTVISTSAGLRAPSFLRRSISASSPASMRLILMPGLLGEVVVQRLVGLVVARRIEVEDLVLREDGPASRAHASATVPVVRRRFMRISSLDRVARVGMSVSGSVLACNEDENHYHLSANPG